MRKLSLFITFALSLIIYSNSNAACLNVTPSFTTSDTNICGSTPTIISFTNTSTGTTSATSGYTWFLNGVQFSSTSGLAVPGTSSISAIGTYNYMLVVFDTANFCTDTAIFTVIIHPTPVASFTIPTGTHCPLIPITFTNTSTGTTGATTYAWTFGNGGTSTIQNPTNNYGGNGGTYTVTLTVTNAVGCVSTVTNTVTTLTTPTLSISGDDGTGDLTNCLSPIDTTTQETVTFSNTTPAGPTFTWSFGDGSPNFVTTSTANFTHVYTTYGTFTVICSAVAANGCLYTDTLTVIFEKFVSASFTVPLSMTSGCAPHIVTPVNASINANTYVWDFGDGSPTVTTTTPVPPTHIYTQTGTYTITLVASNSCNSSTSTVGPIIVSDAPITQFNHSLFGRGCALQTVSFTNTSLLVLPTNNFRWDMGNGNTFVGTNPPPQVYTQGTYAITLIAANGCGEDTAIQIINIDSLPFAVKTLMPIEGCSPLIVNGSAIPTGYQTLSRWYVDGLYSNAGDTLNTQTFINNTSTSIVNHTVRFNLINHCGSFDTITTVQVHPEVIARITPSNPLRCVGDSVIFTSNSSGDSLTYLWTFGNGSTSTSPGPHTIHYPVAITDTIKLVVTGYCGIDSFENIIYVNPYPIASIVADTLSGCEDLAVNFINWASNGALYNWSFAGATPSSSTLYNPSVLFTLAANNQVTLAVDSLGCISHDTAFIDVYPGPSPNFTALPSSGCSPLLVSFNNTSPIASGDTYLWNFGPGNTDTAYSPADTSYTTLSLPTTYPIKLVIFTTNGCKDSLTQNITVHPLPISGFTVVKDSFCEKEPIIFTDTSIGGTTYKWYFGDGDSSSIQHPTHSYDTAGNYTIMLITSSGVNCVDTSYYTITINHRPVAQFFADTACFTYQNNFTDSSLYNPISWSWSFGDGGTSTLQNPSHIYGNDTSFVVKLIVANNFGCVDSITKSAFVYPTPTAGFRMNTACAKIASTFIDTSLGFPSKWTWDFGDGGIDSVQNPTHIYLLGGTYNVTLIVENAAGCADTTVVSITISTVPNTNFTADTVCFGSPTIFNNTTVLALPVLSYFWTFGDGNSSTAANPIYQYLAVGTYTVSLTVTNINGCDSTYVDSVRVDSVPTASFIFDTICLTNPTTFTSTSQGNPALHIWNYGDGTPLDTVISSVSTHTYLLAGTYVVKLIIENIHGCKDSTYHSIIVHPSALSSFIALDDSVCLNESITFLNNSVGGFSYQWIFGDGNTSTVTNPTHTYATAGTFQVQLIATTFFGCTDTSTINVEVHPNPTANFTTNTVCLNSATLFTNTSTGINLTYAWQFGDGNNDTVQHPSHTFAFDSTYFAKLIVTTQFNCVDSITNPVIVLPRVDAYFSMTNACVNRNVAFTDSSLGSPTTWNWNFGDGGTSALQNPNHIYLIAGSYNVTLIATNAAGCSDTLIKILVVSPIPVPNFTFDTVCYGNVTHFTNTSTNILPITNYHWNFGDGNTSTAPSPGYSYSAPGTYNVTLTITNSGGCDTNITQTILVNSIPIANYTHDTVCVGLPTTFTDISAGLPTHWVWSFGDFSPVDSSGAIVTHNYATAGTYTASLTVRSGLNNCSSISIKVITVHSGANAVFTMPTPVCHGTNITFTNNSTTASGTITSSFWSFGDGNTSNSTHPTHTYALPGVYNVSLFVGSTFGCTDRDSLNVVINPLPKANFGFVPNVCLNNPTQFTDSSTISAGNIISWAWSFGDGNTSTLQNPINIYTTGGTFQVALTVTSDSGCIHTTTQILKIAPAPKVDFTHVPVCLGTPMQFTNLSLANLPDSIISYLWDFGDGNTSTLKNPFHTYIVLSQFFNVKLTVVTKFGCTNDTTITISHLPVPVFNFKPMVYGACLGDFIQFRDSSTIPSPGVITTYQWDFGDGNGSFLKNPLYKYNTTGTFYITLKITTSKGCVSIDSIKTPIIIYPIPVAKFDATPNKASIYHPIIKFDNKSAGAVNYEWDYGDGNTSIIVSPTHRYNSVGFFTVRLIAHSNFGCKDTAYKVIEIHDEYSLYVPNSFTPNDDIHNRNLVVQGYQVFNYNLKIFNRWGEMIFESNALTDSWDGKQNGEECKVDSYVYIINITDVNGNIHTKRGHVNLIR